MLLLEKRSIQASAAIASPTVARNRLLVSLVFKLRSQNTRVSTVRIDTVDIVREAETREGSAYIVVVAELLARPDAALGEDDDVLRALYCHDLGVTVGLAAVVHVSRESTLPGAAFVRNRMLLENSLLAENGVWRRSKRKRRHALANLFGRVDNVVFVDAEQVGGIQALRLVLPLPHVLQRARDDLANVLDDELLGSDGLLREQAPSVHGAAPELELLRAGLHSHMSFGVHDVRHSSAVLACKAVGMSLKAGETVPAVSP